MIPEDRLKKILALIEQNQSITVGELTAALYVSPATIRRDLAELSRRGMILRSFGGALSITTNARAAQERHEAPHTPVGERAARMIRDRSVLFLGHSALTLSMTPHLTRYDNLTVVTDSPAISDALCGSIAHLYCTGGRFLPQKNRFAGRQAAEFAARFHFDQCFFSCDGVTPDGQLTCRGTEDVFALLAAMRRSARSILLCTAEQLGITAPNVLMDLARTDAVVTDAPNRLPPNYPGLIVGVGHETPAKKSGT